MTSLSLLKSVAIKLILKSPTELEHEHSRQSMADRGMDLHMRTKDGYKYKAFTRILATISLQIQREEFCRAPVRAFSRVLAGP